jgi:hypothetical protein
MRKLSTITAPIIAPLAKRSYDRRPIRSAQSSFTCLVLVRHAESDGQILVSDDGDAVGAIWLSKAPLLIDPKDRGPFLVVTLTHQLATQKRLRVAILDWSRYTDQERLLLKDAVEVARRTRSRLSGFEDALPFPGRNMFA